jgi:EF-P beta-lysylation protein EpmB
MNALVNFCQIAPSDRSKLSFSPKYAINVPYRLAEKMEKGNIDDPLFRQFVPFLQEHEEKEGFTKDPLHEEKASCCGRVLQKYYGRALLHTTSTCAAHCRFCFRQHTCPSEDEKTYVKEMDFLSSHSDIREVILSGGDPLSLSTPVLSTLLQRIDSIPHIERIRIHSRFLIGIPERVDSELISSFANVSKQLYFVLHVNHPHEIDIDVKKAMKRIQMLGIPTLSQTVLLKGVNDSLSVLENLMNILGSFGVIPYYLHQLDRVQGASHFEADMSEGLLLAASLHSRLSGFLVPRYAKEVPGDPGKRFLA